MEMFLLRVLLMLTPVLSIDGATWSARYGLYTVGMFQDAVMECDISGANFTGFYRGNGEKITETKRIKIQENKDDGTVTLEITRITEEDYAKFICKDSSGTAVATLEIQVSLDQNPKSPQILVVGDPGVVNLRVYANPKHKMAWSLMGKKIAEVDGKGKMKRGQPLYRINPQGSLHIEKVTPEHAGNYQIIVTTVGARVKGSVTAKVEYKLELKTKPQSSLTRSVGQDLFIKCEWLYADKELPTWTFTSNGGITKTITKGITKTGLLLKAVTMASEGTYTCGASNKYGNRTVQSSLTKVIDPAKILTDLKQSIKKKLSTSYELVCEASGKPVPTVRLSKKTPSGFKPVMSGSGKVAKKFPKLQIADGGLYSCYADNGATTVAGESLAQTKNITLEVFAQTKIEDATNNIISAIGRAFDIECSAKGYPYPKIELLGNGVDVTTKTKTENDVVTAKLIVTKATQSNFAYNKIICQASNAYGKENVTIPITQIVKAASPKNVRSDGTTGLIDIDLQWDPVKGADKYIIYINDTIPDRTVQSTKVKATIKNLKRSTVYSIKVASSNLAGIGKKSKGVVFVTADIIVPNAVSSIQVKDLTSQSALVTWDVPVNVRHISNIITFRAEYCVVKNDSVSNDCKVMKERKESQLLLKNLVTSTTYEIRVLAVNQGQIGLAAEAKQFTTKVTPPPTDPPMDQSIQGQGGLSSGEIAGIAVAIILIILIVVDLFCCFFNNCGFSHCCFETFCAAKDKKFLPVETTEGYEVQELEEKPSNIV